MVLCGCGCDDILTVERWCAQLEACQVGTIFPTPHLFFGLIITVKYIK